ncbi:Bestrophin, RFP-TM, chloride channel-domain-containing protein [Lentinula novae-zelandiae]|nr:Bestrophin, RFP-TM, chloride channel-domain-containing protein [Lentinula novae-zelandiae]
MLNISSTNFFVDSQDTSVRTKGANSLPHKDQISTLIWLYIPSPNDPTSTPSDFGLQRTGTLLHKGFKTVQDPYAGRQRTGASLVNALLATALFRCWHLLIFFGAWATLICVLNAQGHRVIIQPTLLTVTGTVLGFVISYRTTSSFERYNEGRRLWSQIVLASRTFARTVWFHIPELLKARAMIEKKTVINLIEAFGVAVKHYLRGEDGIYYEDLYYLVKFLPSYALPTGLPSNLDLTNDRAPSEIHSPPGSPISTSFHRPSLRRPSDASRNQTFLTQRINNASSFSDSHLPLPATAHTSAKTPFREPQPADRPHQATDKTFYDVKSTVSEEPAERVILPRTDEVFLFPAKMPPKYHLFDLFPFSLLVRVLTNRGKELKGKKAAKLRAKMKNKSASHNLPLEISLYLSSYISALQIRKTNEVPTTNTMLAALNQLVDSLTGLERILTTPIPFSYVLSLTPPQIWPTLSWKTIPATVILAFMFFGFLVAGEEIENPFGYDKNDLNLDHFTHNIIRNELRAITSTPAPDPARWAFAPENDLLFASDVHTDERVTPQEWIGRGYIQMQHALSL